MRSIALALVFVVALAFTVSAATTRPARYVAHVRCDHVAEDSLAHVALTRYAVRANGTRVIGYRCK